MEKKPNKIIVKANGITKEYDTIDDAIKDIQEWYTSTCDDENFAENVLYALLNDLCDERDGKQEYLYEEDKEGNWVFERNC